MTAKIVLALALALMMGCKKRPNKREYSQDLVLNPKVSTEAPSPNAGSGDSPSIPNRVGTPQSPAVPPAEGDSNKTAASKDSAAVSNNQTELPALPESSAPKKSAETLSDKGSASTNAENEATVSLLQQSLEKSKKEQAEKAAKAGAKITTTATAVAPPKFSGAQTANSSDTQKAAKGVSQKLDKLAQGAEGKQDASATEEDKARWTKLTEYIVDHGKQEESPTGYFFTLTDDSPNNPDQAFIRNQISAVGATDAKGNFGFSRVQAVWEDWKIDSKGNYDVDMWQFLVSRDGNIAKTMRHRLVKDKEDHVLLHEGVNATDAEFAQKWKEMREFWFQKTR